jgi:hypothetical protein
MLTFKDFLETPDFPFSDKSKRYHSEDAVTFAVFKKFVLFGKSDGSDGPTHLEIGYAVSHYIHTKRRNPSAEIGVVYLQKILSDLKLQIIGSVADFGDYCSVILRSNAEVPRDRDLGEVTGRLWTDSKIIAVWKNRWNEVSKQGLEGIEKLITHLHGSPTDYAWEIADRNAAKKIYKYDEVRKEVGHKSVSVGAQFDHIKHVMNPEQKAILKAIATKDTNVPLSKMHDVADGMGISVAQLKNMAAAESTIPSFKTFLESPDYPNDVIEPFDHDAFAFTVFEKFIVYGARKTHQDISSILHYYKPEQDDGPVKLLSKRGMVLIGKPEDFAETAAWIKVEGASTAGRDLGLVTGRFWKVSKVCSIWKDSWDEVSHETFERIKKILPGNPEEYGYDDGFRPSDSPFFTIGEVEDMLRGEKVSVKDRYKDIMHVMNPEQKAILKAISTKDVPYSKINGMADDLGISVAQLRQMSVMGESLNESALSYSVPSSPQVLMADFYLLSYMAGVNLGKMREFKPDHKLFYASTDATFEAVNAAAHKLFPFLKKHLLDSVFYSMCAEFRHVFSETSEGFTYDEYAMSSVPSGEELTAAEWRLKKKLGNDGFEFLETYFGKKTGRALGAPHKSGDIFNAQRTQSLNSVMAALKIHDKSQVWFVNLAYKVYRNLRWDPGYGGKAWAGICEGWLKLFAVSDSDTSHLAVYIDHIYDLQHNNDTVFDKIKSYADEDEDYEWIKRALDFKANVKNPRQLMDAASSDMKKLGARMFGALDTPEFADNKHQFYDPEWDGKVWAGGIWTDGKWKSGTWKGGTWLDGQWEGGEWQNGTWKDGYFKSGIWKNGIWKYGEFSDKAVWKNGTWKDGFFYGTWENGTWEKGLGWKSGWSGKKWIDGIIVIKGKKYRSKVAPNKYVPKPEDLVS